MALPNTFENRTVVGSRGISTTIGPRITSDSGPISEPRSGFVGAATGLYTPFMDGDMIANQEEEVTSGLWSNNVGTLLTFFTSSTQTAAQKTYYYEVFQSASSNETAAPQFSVAYGQISGLGSAESGTSIGDYPAKAIYSQYRQLLLESNDSKFTFNGIDSDQIFVVNINRARMKERLDEGNFELPIAPLVGYAANNNAHTGSNVVINTGGTAIKLIDDSTIASPTITSAGKIYNLVSGSIVDGVYNPSSPHYYGLLYPNHGVAVINGDLMNLSCSFDIVSGSGIAGDNAFKMYTAISGAAANFGYGFKARSAEQVKSTYYFVRVKNQEYNYSNNPSYVTGSEGELLHSTFVTDPRTYITTVGLYNDRQELLATAKLSKPVMKSFTNEVNLKVKLDY